MGYSPLLPRGASRLRWWSRWRHPQLDLPGPYWNKVDTKITVEPDSAHRERWNWRVTLLCNGRQNPSQYSEGGTRRNPAPDVIAGRARDEGSAWEQAREVVDNFRARWAAEQLRRSMVNDQNVPL